jgi:hypothetical protein
VIILSDLHEWWKSVDGTGQNFGDLFVRDWTGDNEHLEAGYCLAFVKAISQYMLCSTLVLIESNTENPLRKEGGAADILSIT